MSWKWEAWEAMRKKNTKNEKAAAKREVCKIVSLNISGWTVLQLKLVSTYRRKSHWILCWRWRFDTGGTNANLTNSQHALAMAGDWDIPHDRLIISDLHSNICVVDLTHVWVVDIGVLKWFIWAMNCCTWSSFSRLMRRKMINKSRASLKQWAFGECDDLGSRSLATSWIGKGGRGFETAFAEEKEEER